MIYTVLKNDRTSRGRATLWEFLKSGKDQKFFQIPDEYLIPFTTASKKYGLIVKKLSENPEAIKLMKQLLDKTGTKEETIVE